MGDDRAVSGSGRVADQQPPALVGEDGGVHGVLPVLADDEAAPVLVADGRAAETALGAADDAGMPGRAEMFNDLIQVRSRWSERVDGLRGVAPEFDAP